MIDYKQDKVGQIFVTSPNDVLVNNEKGSRLVGGRVRVM